MTIIYDHSFDANEWYVISAVVILNIVVWLAPKRFTLLEGIAYFSYGVFFGMFFDHTISVPPWDFYDVNDTSQYQFMDFLSYVMYGPYSYLFVYFYAKFNNKGFMNIVYIVLWSCFAILSERVAIKVGLFHYGKGFTTYWSIPIYLIAQTALVAFYHLTNMKKGKNDSV